MPPSMELQSNWTRTTMLPVNPCWFPTSAVLYSTGPQPNFIIIIGSRMFSGDTVFIFIYFTYNPLKVSSVLLLMTGSPPFSWLNNISLCVLTSIFFIHSSIDRHLHCFHILAVVNKAAVDTGVWVYLPDTGFVSFRYMPKSGIAQEDHVVPLFF